MSNDGGTPNDALGSEIVRAGSSNVSQFVLGTLPYAGGLGALFANLAARRRGEQVDSLLAEAAGRIGALEAARSNTIDRDFLDSNEFGLLVASVVEQIGVDAQQEKLEYLRRFLVNSVRRFRPDITLLEAYLQLIGPLTGTHVYVLECIYRRQESASASDRLGSVRTRNVPVAISSLGLRSMVPALTQIVLSELVARGLLVDWTSLADGSGRRDAEFCVTRSGYGLMRFLTDGWTLPPGESLVD